MSGKYKSLLISDNVRENIKFFWERDLWSVLGVWEELTKESEEVNKICYLICKITLIDYLQKNIDNVLEDYRITKNNWFEIFSHIAYEYDFGDEFILDYLHELNDFFEINVYE